MRKALFAASLLALGFSSCKKQDVIVNTEPAKPPFRVSGVSDILVTLNPFYQQSIIAQQQIGVVYEHGDQKRVSLRLEDLPAGIKDSFYVRSGYPDFSTAIVFYNEGIKSGSYTTKLVVQADGEPNSMQYPFQITVQGDTSCTGYFGSKNFEGTNSCLGPNQTPYAVNSVRLNTVSDTLVFNNYKNDGTALKLVINCRSRIVVVPMQNIGGNIIQGSGQLLANSNSSLLDAVYVSLSERTPSGNITYCTHYFQLK